MIRRLSMLALFVSLPAFAQDAVPVIAPPTNAWAFLAMLLTFIAPLVGKWLADAKQAKALQRAQLVHELAEAAYWATNEAKALGVNVPQAVLYAEKMFLDAMKAAGLDASPGEIQIARFRWKAINGAAKTAVSPSAVLPKVAGPF